jgi:hypothetical protein
VDLLDGILVALEDVVVGALLVNLPQDWRERGKA